MTVLVNQRLIGNGLLRILDIGEHKLSSSISADLIFTDCMPSLTIKFCEVLSSKTVDELSKLQKQFKNAFAICIGNFSNDEWNAFQVAVPGGNLCLMRCVDYKSAAALSLQCYNTMKDNDRFKLQSKFFEFEKERVCSSEQSRMVTLSTLSLLGIPDFEASLLIDQFPTINKLVCATEQQLAANSLIEDNTINNIISLFGTSSSPLPK